MDEQLRLTDLIPRRPVTIAAVMLAGLSVVAGLEILYTYTHGAAWTTTQWQPAAFDLDGDGSLAVWFSSALLMAAAVIAMIVYTVRRHRTDDYQGRYRIWLAAAACWTLMSIDATAKVHDTFKELTTQATGTRLLGDGSIWWVVPCFFLFGAVGSRLVVDMHKCRLSTAALLAAGGCYVPAIATQLGLVLSEGGPRSVMLQSGTWLLGNLLLLMAMVLHGRYVIMDAEGLVPNRNPDSEEEEEDTAEEWIKIDSAHQTPQPVLKRRTRQTVSVSADSPVRRRLTKAEKKSLRKRLIQQRTERERSQHGAWK